MCVCKMDELIYDFGVLPDYVGLKNDSSTPAQLEIGVRFLLELWRVQKDYQLRHAHQIIEWPATEPIEFVRFGFVRPAKGPGLSVIALKSTALKYPTTLLNARYDDLEWMRNTAGIFGDLLNVSIEENDWGYDY